MRSLGRQFACRFEVRLCSEDLEEGSLQEIIDQADQLAARFQGYDPDLSEVKDAAALRAVRRAAHARAQAEAELADMVSFARASDSNGAILAGLR